jgi:hypothetical protein
MKRLMYLLSILSILLLACTISTTATPQTPATIPATTEPPTATELPTATEPPAATELPLSQANVTCHELALFMDPALASGFNCETVPASTEGMEMYPQYTRLTLQGYILSDKFFTAHISIYSIKDYTNLLPDNIPADVAALKALIGGGSTGDKGLPFLPYFNAGQEFFAQYKVISFESGNGIRFLTQYSQYFDPINNHELFYTLQGLTGDGKYWISAILPITNPILPADGNTLPNGQSQEEFGNNFTIYMADLTNQLNGQPAESFSPGIGLLDSLIASIRVQP